MCRETRGRRTAWLDRIFRPPGGPPHLTPPSPALPTPALRLVVTGLKRILAGPGWPSGSGALERLPVLPRRHAAPGARATGMSVLSHTRRATRRSEKLSDRALARMRKTSRGITGDSRNCGQTVGKMWAPPGDPTSTAGSPPSGSRRLAPRQRQRDDGDGIPRTPHMGVDR
jgi:hypothetical protein